MVLADYLTYKGGIYGCPKINFKSTKTKRRSAFSIGTIYLLLNTFFIYVCNSYTIHWKDTKYKNDTTGIMLYHINPAADI